MLLVRFLGVAAKREIPDYAQYVRGICGGLDRAGLVSQLIVSSLVDSEGEIEQKYAVIDVTENLFRYRYVFSRDHRASVFEIAFEFGTYGSTLQLEISISSDNYELSPEDNYLERVKFKLKDSIKDDWEQRIWLLDKDSEMLAKELYPHLFKAENLLRQTINELMVKRYGVGWWEKYVPVEIKQKHSARMVGYKAVVPGFANVDEKLLSIDIGDLKDILTMQRKKWVPMFHDGLNAMLTHRSDWKDGTVKSILEKQLEVEEDLWVEQFSRFLPEDFPEKVRVFDLNRNHIAHDKLIDRAAYHSIRQSIQEIVRDLEAALKQIGEEVVSQETKREMEEAEAEEQAVYATVREEIMENEAGVEIRSYKEIAAIFEEAVQDLHSYLEDTLRFRADIDLSDDIAGIDLKECTGTLFSILWKIEDVKVEVQYELSASDEQGASSILALSIAGDEEHESFQFDLEYINGEVKLDEEQGCYYPLQEDGITNLGELQKELGEYMQVRFKNWREAVDLEAYVRIKDGGVSPVADIPCWNCYESYICIDETYQTYGKCLNCGEHNDIALCDRCGSYYEGDPDAPGPHFCEECRQRIEDE